VEVEVVVVVVEVVVGITTRRLTRRT